MAEPKEGEKNPLKTFEKAFLDGIVGKKEGESGEEAWKRI